MKKNKRLLKLINLALTATYQDGVLNKGRVNTLLNLFKMLPTSQAIYCIQNYLILLKRKMSEQRLEIEAAIPLSPQDIIRIEKSFGLKHKINNSTFNLNPSLLAGLRVKIGDQIFDDSLKSRISEVKKTILN